MSKRLLCLHCSDSVTWLEVMRNLHGMGGMELGYGTRDVRMDGNAIDTCSLLSTTGSGSRAYACDGLVWCVQLMQRSTQMIR